VKGAVAARLSTLLLTQPQRRGLLGMPLQPRLRSKPTGGYLYWTQSRAQRGIARIAAVVQLLGESVDRYVWESSTETLSV